MIRELWKKLNLKEDEEEVSFGWELTELAGDDSGKVSLKLKLKNGNKTVTAEEVILALPKRPLQKLTFPEPVRKTLELDSVVGLPLLKAFFVIDQPWWEDEPRP